MRSTQPLRIVLAFANAPPGDPGYLRALGTERRRLTEKLAGLQAQGFIVDVAVDATRDELIALLQRPEAQHVVAFHYAGHATGESLVMAGEGDEAPAAAGGVARLLGALPRLRLVFLNGCSTGPQVDALRARGVPAIIATDRAIDDALATDFAEHFYGQLAAGGSLRRAFDDAEAAMHTRQGEGAALWREGVQRSFAPVGVGKAQASTGLPWRLHTASDEDFSLPELAGRPLFGLPAPPPRLPARPFPGATPYEARHARVFFGRDGEVRAVHDALCVPPQPQVVLLTGAAQVGKTSLLQAGVLPRLGEGFEPLILPAQDPPDEALAAALGVSPEGAAVAAAWASRAAAGRHPVLVLDPVDACPQARLERLLAWLAEPLAAGAGRALLSARLAHRAGVIEACERADLTLAQVHLEDLDGPAMARAVTGLAEDPALAEHYRVDVDPRLPAQVEADLGASPRVAPFLSVALEALWARAAAAGTGRHGLTLAHYAALAHEGTLLGPHVDELLGALKALRPVESASGLVHDLLAWHTTALGISKAPIALDALQARYRTQPTWRVCGRIWPRWVCWCPVRATGRRSSRTGRWGPCCGRASWRRLGRASRPARCWSARRTPRRGPPP